MSKIAEDMPKIVEYRPKIVEHMSKCPVVKQNKPNFLNSIRPQCLDVEYKPKIVE